MQRLKQYWSFRLAQYQQHLQAWLNSIKQAAAGIVYLFPMALPALFLLPLLALGVIADAETPVYQYSLALWGFLLLTHSWVTLQKEGILAEPVTHYDSSLPLTSLQRRATTTLLTLYAAHVFITGPILLFFIMALGNAERLLTQPATDTFYQLFPIAATSLLTVLIIVLALFRRYPLFGLIIVPLILMPFTGLISKPLLVLIWGTLLVIEQRIPAVPYRFGWLPRGLIRLYINADIDQPNKGMLRLISLLILMIGTRVFMQSVAAEAANAAGYFFSFLVGILMASKLIDTLEIKARYQHYLNTLPTNRKTPLLSALVYSTFYCIPLMAIVMWFDAFALHHWSVLAVIFISTKTGILLNKNYFLIFPCCTALLLWWLF